MNKLGSVFERSTDAVFGIDTAGTIQFANSSFERLMGYSGQQLCGTVCAEVLCGTDLHGRAFCGPNCPIPKTVTDQPTISDFDLVVRRADGDSVLVNIGASYLSAKQRQSNTQVDVFFSLRQVNPRRLLQRMATSQLEESINNVSTYRRLTSREKEILALAASGMNTNQIAQRLSISTPTLASTPVMPSSFLNSMIRPTKIRLIMVKKLSQWNIRVGRSHTLYS